MSVRTIGFRQQSVTIPGGLAAVSLSAGVNKFVTDFEVHSLSTNVGQIYIGDSTVSAAWIPIEPGITKNYVHGTGVMIGEDPVGAFNFKNLFIKGTNAGDTVRIQYFEYELS